MAESEPTEGVEKTGGAPPKSGAEQFSGGRSGVVTRVAEFAQLAADPDGAPVSSLDSLLDIKVGVTAELGRISLPIGEVLKLSVGSVLELDRLVSEPVELFVQGRRLARGEVVVVDDRFAIRIKDLAEPKKRV
jgi:flagellar motor switch protein FliN/FliY